MSNRKNGCGMCHYYRETHDPDIGRCMLPYEPAGYPTGIKFPYTAAWYWCPQQKLPTWWLEAWRWLRFWKYRYNQLEVKYPHGNE